MRWFRFVFALLLACTGSAMAQNIETVLAPGKLIQGHAKTEENCSACHLKFDRNAQDRLCMDCHKDVGQDVRGKQGYHGRMKPQACRSCHTDHKGRELRIAEFDRKAFDHAVTDFGLKGAHLKVDCAKCHVAGKKWREAANDCVSCHRKDDVHKGGLGAKCADCHTDSSWKEAKFDHESTRFPLTGKHTDTKCADCHKDKNYKETPRDCYSCHRKDDDRKGHKGQYGEKCDGCHATKGWKPSTFSHDQDTKYLLRGKHRAVRCNDCHTGHIYKVKPSQVCVDCHRKDDKHKESLGRDCASCHTERDWKEKPKVDHEKTNFPLRGKHVETRCESCHKSLVFKEAPTTCIGCHRKDDTHKGTLGDDCAACHGERDWKKTSFDHAKTRFALRGKHVETKCGDCHKSTNFKEVASTCIGCHRKDDTHKGSLGEDCAACHGEASWKKTSFDHAKTKFPLLGRHQKTECKECHKSTDYKQAPKDCIGCHRKDDKHEGQEGTRCESCHVETDWKTTPRFDHGLTRFPLLGKHGKVECKDCHKSARFKDAQRGCVACHLKDDTHKKTLGPACEQCHNAREWKAWDFDHDKRTKYVLDGKHKGVACKACHTQPMDGKVTASTRCYACHAKRDVHDGSYGRQCEQCHVTSSFRAIRSRSGAAPTSFLERRPLDDAALVVAARKDRP